MTIVDHSVPSPDGQHAVSGTQTDGTEGRALLEQPHPACDPEAVQTVLWLSRAQHAAVNAQTEALRPLDLSPNAFNVLLALHGAPDHTLEPCQLSVRLDVSRPAVTGLLDTLERKGLVVRRPHSADRRRLLIALTAAGRALLVRHLPIHYARLNALVEALSEDEMATLVRLLQRIRGATPDHVGDEA